MKRGVIRASSTITKIKLPKALARNKELAEAGDMRYASSTWLRSSRGQVWFRTTMAANRNATQTRPPAILRDSSAVGSKAKLKITTTSNEKNSMALIAAFDRPSRRRSFASVARMTARKLIVCPPAVWRFGQQFFPSPSTQIHPLPSRGGRADGSLPVAFFLYRAFGPAYSPFPARYGSPYWGKVGLTGAARGRSRAAPPRTFCGTARAL